MKRRVDRLEATGVIRGYTRSSTTPTSGAVEAFAELRFAGSTRVDDIEEIAHDVPEVHAIFTVAGDPDALAWIRRQRRAEPQARHRPAAQQREGHRYQDADGAELVGAHSGVTPAMAGPLVTCQAC